MQRWLFVCLIALSPAVFAQSGGWQSEMAQGYASERAGNYAEAAAEYRSALHIVEQSPCADANLPRIWDALGSASKRSPTVAEVRTRRAHEVQFT